jgi:hypothetical protein
MCTLDDPTASAKPGVFVRSKASSPACPDVRSKNKLLDPLADLEKVVSIVET